MSSPEVLYARDNLIGRITLNAPDRMNTLTTSLMSRLFDVREANADGGTRAVIVTGAGEHFCAGGDLEWEGDLDEDKSMELLRLSSHLSYELRNSPKPMIGAIRGWCLGGGNELNLHLDVSIASETAKFAQPETRWGLLPFWFTPQLLPMMIGERRAREVMLWGRLYDADQALEIGLCNAVVPDDQLEAEADRWAEELFQRSATAVRLTKIALNSATDMMRATANHEAAMVSLMAGGERYLEEAGRFYKPGERRRPFDAPPRRVTGPRK